MMGRAPKKMREEGERSFEYQEEEKKKEENFTFCRVSNARSFFSSSAFSLFTYPGDEDAVSPATLTSARFKLPMLEIK